MEGNQEVTLPSTGKQLAETQKPLEVKEAVKPPTQPSIVTKLVEVRTSAQTHLQLVRSLLESGQPESVSGVGENVDARLLLEELAKSKGLSPSEYLQRSQHALNASSSLRGQIDTDRGALESSIRQKDSRWQIDRKLRELEEAKGLKRIPAVLEKRRLTKQKAGIQQEIEAIGGQVQAKIDQLAQLQEHETPIQQKREELILAELLQAVQAVKAEYEGLLREVIEDGTITGEIRDAYIQRVIAPKVDKMMEKRKLPKSRSDEFYKALGDYVDHRSSSDEEKRVLKEKLDSFLTYEAEFWETRDDCQTLVSGRDEQLVRQLVATLAAEDIAPIRAIAEPHYSGWESREKLSKAFKEAIEPVDSRDTNSFGNQISSALSRTNGDRYPDMNFWQAVKDSPTANLAFGEIIRRQDQEYYQTALDKSLSDTEGGYIDLLRYYPTPNSIRNLVALASADSQNYRTVHANWALCALAKRPDWGEILDEAEKVYPTFRGAREILQSWDYGEDGNESDIQLAAGEFALSIFEQQSNDPRLIELAKEAIPNELIVGLLAKRGVLTPEQAHTLEEATVFLRNLSKETWEKHRTGDDTTPYVEDYFFHKSLRENLFGLLGPAGVNAENSKMVVGTFGVLSNLILENKSDLHFLDSLVSSQLIDGLKDPAKRGESALTFITQFRQIEQLLSSDSTIGVNKDNWISLLMAYVRVHNEVEGLPQFPAGVIDKINTLFDDSRVRDFCLESLVNQWRDYLKNGKPGEIPKSLMLLPGFVEYCGSAGPLSQLESLSSLINSVDRAFSRSTTVDRTKEEICQGLSLMEEKQVRERWSNEDRADFYNISRDVINAAPSIFSDCLNLFSNLNPSKLRQFTKEIYPLYRTKLVLMEKKDNQGNKSYDRQQLIQLRRDIRNLARLIGNADKPFETEKKRLLDEIKERFKDRFGIIKIPENFTQEHMRSFTNVSTYLANMHARTPEKETTLGFYLSLMINDQWDKFRQGESFDPDEYLTPDKSYTVKNFLRERQRLSPLTSENLGIPADQMPDFMKLLQQETQNLVVGNIETIDVKLANIIINLQGLEDPDLYPDKLDKQRLGLLLDWGNKKVGSVVARMYQKAANSERQIQFSEEDDRIQQQILKIINESGLGLTPQTLKQHFQDGIRPLSTVVNLLNSVREAGAEGEITSLRRLLEPSPDVIEIFQRLREDFKPGSGALPLSRDLSYLDNFIVKREDELRPEEKTILIEYISSIREQVVKLESIYAQIKSKIGGFQQGQSATNNPLLKDKLAQIDRIINAQETQQAVMSTVSNNLNIIIENIRECLSCTREGSNNDTDLTFGDTNKFYLYSQTGTQEKGSISDELLFVEPITRADGTQGVAFVMDRIYGTNTPVILGNHIEAVLKKYRIIKQRFPDAKLSVFVSDAAASTGGISIEMLLESLKQKGVLVNQESIEVNVMESATGDHYIEFGGSARTAGKRQVGGIVIV